MTVATALVPAGASGLSGEINPMVKKNQAVIGAQRRVDLPNSIFIAIETQMDTMTKDGTDSFNVLALVN